jgi:hypothetical protein
VSEGTGWAARLRRVMNARMEEMSFRSGVALFAAVLALTGTGIAFTVTLGVSHGAAAAPPASSATAAQNSTAPASSAAAEPSPSASPSPDQGSPVYGSGPAVADASSPGTTTQAASPQSSPAPSSPSPTYRPMGLAPSHSLTSPGPGGPVVDPPPGWIPP